MRTPALVFQHPLNNRAENPLINTNLNETEILTGVHRFLRNQSEGTMTFLQPGFVLVQCN